MKLFLFTLFLFFISLYSDGSNQFSKNFTPIYQQRILSKIKSGVPFELVVVENVLNKENSCRKTIHIKYDLWDELITMTLNSTKKSIIRISQFYSALIKNLPCFKFQKNHDQGSPKELSQDKKKKQHLKTRIQILMDPIWEGRVQRVLSGWYHQKKGFNLFSLNAEEIARTMDKEVLIFDWVGPL